MSGGQKINEHVPLVVASIEAAWGCGTADRRDPAFLAEITNLGKDLIRELNIPDESAEDMEHFWGILVVRSITKGDNTPDELLTAFEEKLEADELL